MYSYHTVPNNFGGFFQNNKYKNVKLDLQHELSKLVISNFTITIHMSQV